MASQPFGEPRGRRKQAKPQRKVELSNETGDGSSASVIPESSLPSPMSPDSNHNEIMEEPPEDDFHKRLNGNFKEASLPEEVLNGLSMRSTHQKLLKTGGTAEDGPNDLISVEAALGDSEQLEDAEKIKEYLQRSDTAVIYPEEPVGHSENVSPLTNGVNKDTTNDTEYYIKCPQCQKGCQTFQALKEHMESAHAELASTTSLSENGSSALSTGAISPTPSLLGNGGPFGCSQCTTSFTTKDQLEKHELLHSPNAQVSCKICNKTFANVYRLQRHMISHDESAILRKFKCTECDKAFKFKHHLKEHIRIHSGEKPFKCPNCGKRFSHSGSYSSHMTSKKCLVMNLKLGRNRAANNATTLLEKSSNRMKQQRTSPVNNNITTSPNHNNAYLPILPKYSEAAAAAFLQNSLASNGTMSPFYLAPPALLNAASHPITPYSMSNLGHIFEQLQHNTSPLRPPMDSEATMEEYKPQQTRLTSPKEEMNECEKSGNSSCGELVMDEDMEPQEEPLKREHDHANHQNNGDLEAVKRILETVNATVTKQFLQANIQKFSTSDNSSDCHSVTSLHSPKQEKIETSNHLEECETDVKSEGLAAKLADIASIKTEEMQDEMDKNDDEMDCESVTTTDHVSEDGRKVRVRSLISDEQLKVLKDNYKLNPRPKREELEKIADSIGFPVRVVQVWFQNTRARDRREGRLIQVPYSPSIPLRFPLLATTTNPPVNHKHSSLSISPNHYICEQPLDLSTKKSQHSNESSPACSPQRIVDHSEEVVNLSQKSSRSPTPYIYPHYQSSNSSEPRQSPSPTIDFNNGSRLAQILAQPAHKLSIPGMGLVPMDQLIQLGATDLPSLSQLISNGFGSLSPNNSRKWHDSEGVYHDEELLKRSKVSQYVLKGLGSPVLPSQEAEVEGQFSCDQCDKSFSKQSSLARHKYEHSGQRPHKCNECPKAFKHKHHLTEHKRLHSGEKPFQCIKCLKRFSHSGSYSQHMNHRYSYCKPYRE